MPSSPSYFRSIILFILGILCLPAVAAPVPLFDGQSLSGWEGDAKWWKAQDGMIQGGSLSETIPQNQFLATRKAYHNFDLRLWIRITGSGFVNSGVQVRSIRVPDNTEMRGYQVDAGEGWWGKLYDESRRNKVVGEAANLAGVNAAVKPGDWNEYRIRAEGPRIQSWINGIPALDYTENDAAIPQDGLIGIQVHGGGKTLVQIKDITVEELPDSPSAPRWPPASLEYKGARTPEEERLGFTVPEGYEVELVAAEDPANGIGKFVPLAFDADGRLWTTTAFEYPVDANENAAAAEVLYTSKARDKVLVFDTPFAPGPQKPRVFAEGLAIPLGVLPYRDGCYVQHGHEIAFLRDTDGDGKADERKTILTGFGVQDSHLFPHQFMRAPGGWIWMAQGAFNYGKVSRPGDAKDKAVQFDQTRMAKFRLDGADFTITSNGPCNIWGLVLNGVGEAFIQEANDYGYPVMPFHEYANYPGCSDRQWKSYGPEFPGTAPDFRMGGTGLSGLALTDVNGPFTAPWRDVMLVANPITNRIQGIKLHRDGPRWRLEKLPDFMTSRDEWFRPVATTIGPDGCLYIVDWYNKIISHNEVPRNHPDRDKTRGRIWRVKAKNAPAFVVPQIAELSDDTLVAKLGGDSLSQSHLAWQTLADRPLSGPIIEKLKALALDSTQPPARRIASLWVLNSKGDQPLGEALLVTLAHDPDRNIRREAISAARGMKARDADLLVGAFSFVAEDPDPEVRAEYGRALGDLTHRTPAEKAVLSLLRMVREPLDSPTAPSTNKNVQIKVREAYDREFERYLVRMAVEAVPDVVVRVLDSPASAPLPLEARLLGCLSLEPRTSAVRVAALLPELQRSPGQEEILRLAEFPDEPGVGDALKKLLSDTRSRTSVLDQLIAVQTRLNAAKLAPLLSAVARDLLAAGSDTRELGLRVATTFKLKAVEPELVSLASGTDERMVIAALKALNAIGAGATELFARLAESSVNTVRDEAIAALATSSAPDATQRIIALYSKLDPNQRRLALTRMSGTKPGALAIVAAIDSGAIPKSDLDGATLDRMQAVLGDDPRLAQLIQNLGSLFRPVLMLDGSEDAWVQTGLSFDGPMTVETWIRLAPNASNQDGILGVPGKLDINFYDGKFRVYAFAPLGDVVTARKPVVADVWTHVAAARDASGRWSIYVDGQLDSTAEKSAPRRLENVRIAWTAAPGGTEAQLAGYRLWNRARSAAEIARDFDRGLGQSADLAFENLGGGDWGRLGKGAKVIRTSDIPPILSADEATALDANFARYRSLAAKPGDIARGKQTAIVCMACHLFGREGGNIGPNLSAVGAMGTEAILRNIITPNAAMENGYRIYRVEMKDGTITEALFVSEDKEAVVVRLPGSPDQRIDRQKIAGSRYLRRSLMPEGLLNGMSDQQVSDLFSFLLSQKQ